MLLRRDMFLVVDIESTCWRGKPPPDEQNEIIEVGVCPVDLARREIVSTRSLLVKPARSKVSPFCTELTTLTQAVVDTGVSFAEACAALQADYESARCAWGSWGDYDRRMFDTQCASFGVAYPFSPAHMNLKALFAQLGKRKQIGMAQALEMTGLKLEGTHHRGSDDAYNIARLLVYMLERSGDTILSPLWEQA